MKNYGKRTEFNETGIYWTKGVKRVCKVEKNTSYDV